MQQSSAPALVVEPWGAGAGASYIHTVPVPSQIGITNGAASWTDGFVPLNFTPVNAGGVPPDGRDMNGVLNALSLIDQWQQAGGLPTYNSAFSTAIGGYPNGAILQSADGTGFWRSTVDNNTSNPDTGGANWLPVLSYGSAAIALSNTNVTLTAIQAAKAIIVLTGTLTANVQLIFPTTVQDWLIQNNTSGAFSVTAKTAAGTGVTVNLGQPTLVWGDGTNLYSINPGQVIIGSAQNLSAGLTSAGTSITFTADEVAVGSALGGGVAKLANFNKTLNTGTTGAGGLDTGTLAANTWLSIYAIYNPTTGASALLGTTASTGTVYGGANMPAGYTMSALLAIWRTNATPALIPGQWAGRTFQYQTAPAALSNGAATSATSVSLSTFVPAPTKSVNVQLNSVATTAGGSTASFVGADANTFPVVTNAVVNTFPTVIFGTIILTTAQTIYYKNGAASMTCTVAIESYSI